MKRSKILFLTIAIFLIIILSAILSIYIHNQIINETDKEIEILVIIDFGSLKESEKHEEHYVSVTEGTSALEAFNLVAELSVLNYPFGAYIKGVNGYLEELPNFWAFYYYEQNLEEWIYSSVGVSHFYLHEGDRIKLQYTG